MYEVDRSFQRGPVKFRVALNRGEITIAEHVNMLLEARAGDGYTVELPGFGDKLHQFGIVDYSTSPPELGDGGEVVTRRLYELEPFLSGDYRIAPMAVTFWREGDTLRHTLESDTLAIRVNSILPEEKSGLEIKDIETPAAFPASRMPVIVIAAGAACAAAVVLFLLRRSRRRGVAPPVPAHKIAFMALERLLSGDLLERKLYREFTAEVADILRRYIEGRFGLRAPERTTEEFLAEARTGLQVAMEQKKILGEFMLYCDLVKFAALEPSSSDVKKTFETCRDFIDSTKSGEEVRERAA